MNHKQWQQEHINQNRFIVPLAPHYAYRDLATRLNEHFLSNQPYVIITEKAWQDAVRGLGGRPIGHCRLPIGLQPWKPVIEDPKHPIQDEKSAYRHQLRKIGLW